MGADRDGLRSPRSCGQVGSAGADCVHRWYGAHVQGTGRRPTRGGLCAASPLAHPSARHYRADGRRGFSYSDTRPGRPHLRASLARARAGPVRPPAVGAVQLRYDRQTQGHRPRSRRRTARAARAHGLHVGLRDDDVFFWFTSPNWMMWNAQIGGLLIGIDHRPVRRQPRSTHTDALWRVADELEVTAFGTSPGVHLALRANAKARARAAAGRCHACSMIGITGSVLRQSATGGSEITSPRTSRWPP